MGFLLLGLGLLGVIILLTGFLYFDGDTLYDAFTGAVSIVGVILLAVVSVILIVFGAIYVIAGFL